MRTSKIHAIGADRHIISAGCVGMIPRGFGFLPDESQPVRLRSNSRLHSRVFAANHNELDLVSWLEKRVLVLSDEVFQRLRLRVDLVRQLHIMASVAHRFV